MIVCICNRVSDRDIARQAKAGLDFEDIRFELGVAAQCGCCESCARDIVAQCRGEVAHCSNDSGLRSSAVITIAVDRASISV